MSFRGAIRGFRLPWLVAALLVATAAAGCSADEENGAGADTSLPDTSPGEGGQDTTQPDTDGSETAAEGDSDTGSAEGGSDVGADDGGGGAPDADGEGEGGDPDVDDPDTTPDVLPDGVGDDVGGDTGDTGDGGDVDAEEGGEEGNPEGGNEPGTGFPAAELGIKIIGPQPYDVGQSLGAFGVMTGLLFGHADVMTWEHLGTGEKGNIVVQPFWQYGGIQLVQGDNPILVTALNEETGEVVTDSITITHNPGFLWDSVPWASPDVVFVGTNTELFVRAAMALASNFKSNSVQLWSVDDVGNPLAQLKAMADNGNTNANCDEVQGDGIFSACHVVNPSTPGLMRFRVRAEVTNVFQTYDAWSPIFVVEAVQPITAAQCNANVGVLSSAKAEYVTMLEAMSPEEAQMALIELLLEDELIAEAGPATDGYGVWVAFTDGLLGALNLSPEGLRGTSLGQNLESEDMPAPAPPINITSKFSTVLAPFASAFGADDEGPKIRDMLVDVGCPAFEVSYRSNTLANTRSFRRLNNSGVISISTHGEALFKGLSAERRVGLDWEQTSSQEVLWTGEAIDCGKLLSSMPTGCNPVGGACNNDAGECVIGKQTRCVDFKQADLRRGRLVFTDTTYAATPEIVTRYARQRAFPRSLVYLGACRSMFNGGWTSAFFGSGARAIAGFSDYVTSTFASARGANLFSDVITGGMLTGASTAFDPDVTEDPDNPGSHFRLFGAKNLNCSDYGMVNGSFESGDLTGWTAAGDGRVVSALACHLPVDGKFMGLISTGLGFTQTVGELKQTFCIELGKTEISFYWKYFSEEFLEFCGSSFQDAFTATLKGTAGQLTMVNVKVDDLCPPGQCFNCGGQYVGLVPSCVSFDVGGVYNTAWQLYKGGIALLAGAGPVTLTLFATDVGDSIYDTVILIDKIDIK